MWTENNARQLAQEQQQLMRDWLSKEVIPYAPYWNQRLSRFRVHDTQGLLSIPVATENDIAGRGGPGNSALLLSPKESDFQTIAPIRGLFGAVRKGVSPEERRSHMWHQYKPVHIHEAGVDKLLAICYSRADLERLHEAGSRLAHVLDIGSNESLLNLVPAGPTLDFWGIYYMGLANQMIALHPRGMGESVYGPARRGLSLLPASVIAVPVEDAANLVENLLDADITLPNLRVIVVVGALSEPGLRSQLVTQASKVAGRRVLVQNAWGPPVGRVLYGEPPVRVAGTFGPHGPHDGSGLLMDEEAAPLPDMNGHFPDDPEYSHGLVTWPDMEILSVRDPMTGMFMPPDCAGELIITSVGWKGTALVQYATGVWVEGLSGFTPHPSTGWHTPRLGVHIVENAWQPLVSTAIPGMPAEASTLARPDLRGIGPIIEEQLPYVEATSWAIQVRQQRLVLLVDRADRAQGQRLVEMIGAHCGVTPRLEVSFRASEVHGQVARAMPSPEVI